MPPWLSGRAADSGLYIKQPCNCNLPAVGSIPTGGSIIIYIKSLFLKFDYSNIEKSIQPLLLCHLKY